MRAPKPLRKARAAGIRLQIDGDDLVLEAFAVPPAAVVDALSQYKPEIVALLRPSRDGWSAEYWQVYFDERAGIAEFDGGLPREEAEARAFACCVVEWLNRHPCPSAPGRCAHCAGWESPGAVVLPFGTEPGTHVWLHAECWPTWHQARRAEAVAAMAAMGIHEPGILEQKDAHATMISAHRLHHAENVQQQDSAERTLNKLARTFATQMEALKRYRSAGEQTVRVEHVTVNEGGRAIVGNVTHRGRGVPQNAEPTP